MVRRKVDGACATRRCPVLHSEEWYASPRWRSFCGPSLLCRRRRCGNRAEHTGDVIRLEDAQTKTVVSIASVGRQHRVRILGEGTERAALAVTSVADFKAKPAMSGVPFLGPWANRLDEQAFYANGTRYAFDMALGNVRGAIPIHGFLTRLIGGRSSRSGRRRSAWVTSGRFFRVAGVAEAVAVRARDRDHAPAARRRAGGADDDHQHEREPMPVAIGFHPYFRLTDSPRDEWTLSMDARTHGRSRRPRSRPARPSRSSSYPAVAARGAAPRSCARRCVRRFDP